MCSLSNGRLDDDVDSERWGPTKKKKEFSRVIGVIYTWVKIDMYIISNYCLIT